MKGRLEDCTCSNDVTIQGIASATQWPHSGQLTVNGSQENLFRDESSWQLTYYWAPSAKYVQKKGQSSGMKGLNACIPVAGGSTVFLSRVCSLSQPNK